MTVYDSLNPYKNIVFVTEQAMGSKKGANLANFLKNECGLRVTVIEMSQGHIEPNGKLPQTAEWLQKCTEKSALASSNHFIIAQDPHSGPMVEAAHQMRIAVQDMNTSFDDIIETVASPTII